MQYLVWNIIDLISILSKLHYINCQWYQTSLKLYWNNISQEVAVWSFPRVPGPLWRSSRKSGQGNCLCQAAQKRFGGNFHPSSFCEAALVKILRWFSPFFCQDIFNQTFEYLMELVESKNVFQVAAEFSILDSPLSVIKRLQKTDHVQVFILWHNSISLHFFHSFL